MMRVCLLNPFPLSFKGGVESMLSSLSSGLEKKGIETEVVSLSESEMSLIPKFARVSISTVLLKKLLDSKSRFDVIHAHAWSACILKLIRDKPSIATAHGTVRGLLALTGDMTSLSSQFYTSFVTQNLEKIGFRNAGKVAAVSSFCKDELVSGYGIPEERISVVYNGIDTEKIHRVKTGLKNEFECENLLFYVGRLAKQKGVEFLIKAMPALKDYDAKLVIAGTGPDEANLRNLVSELNLKESVIFTGAVDERRKLEFLSSSDAFVCPSLWESFGVVLLEAMACKTPIVATRAASIPEVVGDCGVLVEPRNSRELSDGIKNLLDDKKASKKLTQKAYERLIKNFTVERMADSYIKLYAKLIS
ncbi:glycosyltransferase family 4 protein [Candidatus Micrarchaeota archaeon]|nr:glycosyltransferase family 4 protein [Candidatus Micrarchaeota archaeon]